MKTIVTSTFFALMASAPVAVLAQTGPAAETGPILTVETAEDAVLYVSKHGANGNTSADTDTLLRLGTAERAVFDDAGRLVGVLVDLSSLPNDEARVVEIGVEDLVAMPSDRDTAAFRIALTLDDLTKVPTYAGDPGTPPRAALTEDTPRAGTGLTSQAAPGAVTPATRAKGLDDAENPIAGDFDVQERIIAPGREAADG